jgi:asparagine synthase (glutamine-hydrolysing)
MCGFIAFMDQSNGFIDTKIIIKALKHMKVRGPDADGIWLESGVCFGHNRLAIQDLDVRSNQPFHSSCGRYVIIYNGEIYNTHSLRNYLNKNGVALRTKSDTEIILELFALDGVSILHRLRGMFAFVIWDRVEKRAFTARDPYGIKPLYWAITSTGILVASQVKSILATGLVSTAPSARGQAGYWLLGSVPEPFTWFRDVHSIQAGHYAWITNGSISNPQQWNDIAAAWRHSPDIKLPLEEVRDRVFTALRSSVSAHLISDVPVGVFLSGGIDSGALAGIMVDEGSKNLQGITICYDEFVGTQNDELPLASTIAAKYGISHHVRKVKYEEFEADLPSILAGMDQPSVDGINTWYASKAVAELGLKVVVSGIGGDELFQGYKTFSQLPRLVSIFGGISRIPGAMPIAKIAMRLQAQRTGNNRWQELPDWARSIGGAWWLRRGLYAPAELPQLMGKELAAEGLADFSPEEWIGQMSGELSSVGRLAIGQIESTTYLRNQLLRDSDWASMSHSVELRTPLVDSWLLQEMKPLLSSFSRFPNKRLLAEAPASPLPEALIRRAKTGFSIPVQAWLKQMGRSSVDGGPSHAWAREVASTFSGGII